MYQLESRRTTVSRVKAAVIIWEVRQIQCVSTNHSNSVCHWENKTITVINSNIPILNKIYGIKTPKLDVFTLPFDSRSHHSLRFFPEPSPYKVHSDGPGSGDGSILPYVPFANRGSLSSWFWIITSLSTLLRPLPDRKVHQLQLIALISRT